ncbi:DUF3382 domain-containing protein [Escherichia coli]
MGVQLGAGWHRTGGRHGFRHPLAVVFIGTAVVFFFQLLRPAFQKGLKSVSGPKFLLPAIDGSTVKQKLFLVALLVLAVAWPFMVSRGTVDIAQP